MRFGLDYAAGRPSASAIRAAGYDFVVRYLSSGGPTLPGKLLTPDEADDLRAHGISIVSNWETTAARMLDGYGAGVTDARAGLAQVLRCGGRRDRPIYFSADFDATPQQQEPINAYLDGAASVLGRANVGIYGGYWPLSRALDAGTASWGWQTIAWSGGNVDPRISIFQTGEQVYVGGVECDVNTSDRADFGQWDFVQEEPELTPEQDEMLRDVQIQLRGPGLAGWPQLGQDEQGRNRTVVDGLAAALQQIDELRTEISELEATTAELKDEVERLGGHHWPWPFSLIEGPATVVAEQLAKLEQALPDLPLPGWGASPNGNGKESEQKGQTPEAAGRIAASDS
ncbi:DUF1906 domain-containing protein [Nocardia yamanashiensis]|uniref:DUF1906 domain-containing protein n=1 Tax=Nocardia yamanashiensis TaxID=209247 RepID=UPI001E37369C|nr:DUF1906 domain-containing protein [Nocardia yamanashiensis]UGT39009.1 DUF1906 domain-containing protein [Nocardia yamanashiensis]